MTLGLFLTALSLGIRHGIDWDHIAAITDLTSAAENRRHGLVLSLLYALGHAGAVLVLGTAAIVFGSSIPESVDAWMGRLVGATLVALGVWVLVQLVRHGREFRLRSRWMLVLSGTFAGVRRIRSARANRRIAITHAHPHEHGVEELGPTHDHSHQGAESAAVAYPVPAPVQVRAGWGLPWRRGEVHTHQHHHELALPTDPFTSYRGRTATTIGILHGVGIESPTQIAVFVAATSVSGIGSGFTLLLAWVAGLVLANVALAAFAALGLLHAERSFVVYAGVAVFVSIASLAVGTALLLGIGDLSGITP